VPTFLRRRLPALLLMSVTGLLAGCDLLGIEGASALAAKREAEGKAIGGACRHAGRAIEDCYALNKRADKAAMFAGWREMNDYMTENKLEVVRPSLAAPGSGTPPESAEREAPEEAKETATPARKSG
jgi:hypothetical protein